MRIDGVEISDEQVDEFKEAFAEFDINSDGTITSQELGQKYLLEESVFDTDIKSNSSFSEKYDVNKVIEQYENMNRIILQVGNIKVEDQ